MARMARELAARAALLLLPTIVDVPLVLWEGLPGQTEDNEEVFVRLAQLGMALDDVGRPEHAGWALEVLQSVRGAPTTPPVMRRVAGVLLAWQATREELAGEVPSLVGLRHVFDFPRHLAQSPHRGDRAVVARTFIANLQQQLGDDTSSMYLDLVAGLYDELARAQLEVGELRGAIESYQAAIAAAERGQSVRAQMRRCALRNVISRSDGSRKKADPWSWVCICWTSTLPSGRTTLSPTWLSLARWSAEACRLSQTERVR